MCGAIVTQLVTRSSVVVPWALGPYLPEVGHIVTSLTSVTCLVRGISSDYRQSYIGYTRLFQPSGTHTEGAATAWEPNSSDPPPLPALRVAGEGYSAL